MQNLHNVERSAFRRGEYVGYAQGVWNIRKSDGAWVARHRDNPNQFATIRRDTLAAISERLTQIAVRPCEQLP